jgi:hypothetical protein
VRLSAEALLEVVRGGAGERGAGEHGAGERGAGEHGAGERGETVLAETVALKSHGSAEKKALGSASWMAAPARGGGVVQERQDTHAGLQHV